MTDDSFVLKDTAIWKCSWLERAGAGPSHVLYHERLQERADGKSNMRQQVRRAAQ